MRFQRKLCDIVEKLNQARQAVQALRAMEMRWLAALGLYAGFGEPDMKMSSFARGPISPRT